MDSTAPGCKEWTCGDLPSHHAYVQDKNPATNDGKTPLHMAARRGHLDFCRVMLENVQDKNPADNHGLTPLHVAAEFGRLEIYHLIMDNVQDKNPARNNGKTPLHEGKT